MEQWIKVMNHVANKLPVGECILCTSKIAYISRRDQYYILRLDSDDYVTVDINDYNRVRGILGILYREDLQL